MTSEQLRENRHILGMSRAELAGKLKISVESLRSYETDRKDINKAHPLVLEKIDELLAKNKVYKCTLDNIDDSQLLDEDKEDLKIKVAKQLESINLVDMSTTDLIEKFVEGLMLKETCSQLQTNQLKDEQIKNLFEKASRLNQENLLMRIKATMAMLKDIQENPKNAAHILSSYDWEFVPLNAEMKKIYDEI